MSDAPPSTAKVQQEALQTGAPVSESVAFGLGSPINYCLTQTAKVGDMVMSGLDETTFQGQRDTSWIAADGRNVAGSEWQSLTGLANVPDMRGTFPRGKDNGRGLDPNGNLAIGTQIGDQLKSHTHSNSASGTAVVTNFAGNAANHKAAGSSGDTGDLGPANVSVTVTINPTGGTETAPKYCVINFFVKINP